METKYHSFLVRLWTSEKNDDSTWHISLESSESGEKLVFANLNDLLDYFENLLVEPSVLRGDTESEISQ
jgi:hypothetical protein